MTKQLFLIGQLSRKCTYKGYSNILGTQNCLHVQNIEGAYLALSPKLRTELWYAYREGMHL